MVKYIYLFLDCIGLPKHPKLTEIFSVNLLDNTEDIYYTDILILG